MHKCAHLHTQVRIDFSIPGNDMHAPGLKKAPYVYLHTHGCMILQPGTPAQARSHRFFHLWSRSASGGFNNGTCCTHSLRKQGNFQRAELRSLLYISIRATAHLRFNFWDELRSFSVDLSSAQPKPVPRRIRGSGPVAPLPPKRQHRRHQIAP